jgi:L-lactate dehydrogenase (cytochrome)
MRDRGYAEDLMARAGAVGSPVLVLTIDLAVVGARHRDVRNAIGGRPTRWAAARRALDIAAHPRWIRSVALGGRPLTFGNLEKAVPGARSPGAFKEWVDAQFDPSVTWDDIAWVREHWKGRLLVKGVLDPDDARRAVEAGVRHVLAVVKADIDVALGLTGNSSIADVDRTSLYGPPAAERSEA